MSVGKKILTVTRPLLPPLQEYLPYLEEIWKSKWLTNDGHFHAELEQALCDHLHVPFVSLFSNGTLALLVALKVFEVSGEVITTPYSFVATSHSLLWNNAVPVFADIDPRTCNLSPERIEAAITPRTTAILPVHVYGTPCDVRGIDDLASRHSLKVIYDAAHAFGVDVGGSSVLTFGDLSILSFHATKTYSTVEGGAIICHSSEMKRRIDGLRNFGFQDETTVVAPGINAKMNELQAAFGILSLKHLAAAVGVRRRIALYYRRELDGVPGIACLAPAEGATSNHTYFPIFVDQAEYGHTRDELYERMKGLGIYGRRYFYPLISDFPMYRDLPSASRSNLPVAAAAADRVICLPMHAELDEDDARRVVDAVKW